jgi:hypothetical protein
VVATAIAVVLIIISFLVTSGYAQNVLAHLATTPISSLDTPSLIAVHLILAIVVMEISLGIFEILWLIVTYAFDKTFFYIIDVVPSQGRSYEYAMGVVKGGDIVRLWQKMELPDGWTYSDTEQYIKRLPIILRLFYSNKIRDRLVEAIAILGKAKEEGVNLSKDSLEVKKRLDPVLAKKSWHEKLIEKSRFRKAAFSYVTLLICFVVYYH